MSYFLPLLANSQLPTADLAAFDLSAAAQILLRALHLLSAMILVGGTFYLRTVLAPAGEAACYADRRSVWARWVGLTTLFLLASGIYNLFMIFGESRTTGVKLPPAYHMLLLVKFLLALLIMFVMAILAGKTETAQRFRSHMQRWLNIAWLAAIATVVVAGVMRTMH